MLIFTHSFAIPDDPDPIRYVYKIIKKRLIL